MDTTFSNVIWEWGEMYNKTVVWRQYDLLTSQKIETVFSQYKNSPSQSNCGLILDHGQYSTNKFILNFQEMNQYNYDLARNVYNPTKIQRRINQNVHLTTTPTFNGNQQDPQEESKFLELSRVTQWKEFSIQELKNEKFKNEDCSICLCSISDCISVQFSNCSGHYFHKGCIINCFQKGSIKCPICGTIYGQKLGNQPFGTMQVMKFPPGRIPLSGYNVGTIHISYQFPSGIQNEDHPNPGQPYSGTSRVAYLPDDDEGNRVLKLFDIAWKRKLLFTVGTSVTTGLSNTVIWNGVHHKTSTHGGSSSYGFPDPTYFSRVTQELSAKGVFLPQT